MATVQEALVTLLKSEPTIGALLGSPALRYTPDAIPQGTTLPAAAYQLVSASRENTLATIGTLAHPRIQLTVWATSAASRAAVKSALIAFFRKCNLEWKDRTRPREVSGIRFGGILVANDIDERDAASNVYQAFIDLTIWYNEVAA
jgi:hypothetical protein